MSYEEKIENGELFVKCLNTIEDDEGIYLIEGKTYEIVNMDEDTFTILGEDFEEMCCEIVVLKDSNDIKVIE
jgi:hypothetical protein